MTTAHHFQAGMAVFVSGGSELMGSGAIVSVPCTGEQDWAGTPYRGNFSLAALIKSSTRRIAPLINARSKRKS
jgi:hypothetical protein